MIDRSYSTTHEIAFLNQLAAQNRAAYAKYAAIVRDGMRAYDPTVDVAEVLRVIEELQ